MWVRPGCDSGTCCLLSTRYHIEMGQGWGQVCVWAAPADHGARPGLVVRPSAREADKEFVQTPKLLQVLGMAHTQSARECRRLLARVQKRVRKGSAHRSNGRSPSGTVTLKRHACEQVAARGTAPRRGLQQLPLPISADTTARVRGGALSLFPPKPVFKGCIWGQKPEKRQERQRYNYFKRVGPRTSALTSLALTPKLAVPARKTLANLDSVLCLLLPARLRSAG